MEVLVIADYKLGNAGGACPSRYEPILDEKLCHTASRVLNPEGDWNWQGSQAQGKVSGCAVNSDKNAFTTSELGTEDRPICKMSKSVRQANNKCTVSLELETGNQGANIDVRIDDKTLSGGNYRNGASYSIPIVMGPGEHTLSAHGGSAWDEASWTLNSVAGLEIARGVGWNFSDDEYVEKFVFDCPLKEGPTIVKSESPQAMALDKVHLGEVEEQLIAKAFPSPGGHYRVIGPATEEHSGDRVGFQTTWDECLPGKIQAGGIRCCKTDIFQETVCESHCDGEKGKMFSWEEANDRCAELGMRLCTGVELHKTIGKDGNTAGSGSVISEGVCMSTASGCDYDNHDVWSSESCEANVMATTWSPCEVQPNVAQKNARLLAGGVVNDYKACAWACESLFECDNWNFAPGVFASFSDLSNMESPDANCWLYKDNYRSAQSHADLDKVTYEAYGRIYGERCLSVTVNEEFKDWDIHDGCACYWDMFERELDWTYHSYKPMDRNECMRACAADDHCAGFETDGIYCAFWVSRNCNPDSPHWDCNYPGVTGLKPAREWRPFDRYNVDTLVPGFSKIGNGFCVVDNNTKAYGIDNANYNAGVVSPARGNPTSLEACAESCGPNCHYFSYRPKILCALYGESKNSCATRHSGLHGVTYKRGKVCARNTDDTEWKDSAGNDCIAYGWFGLCGGACETYTKDNTCGETAKQNCPETCRTPCAYEFREGDGFKVTSDSCVCVGAPVNQCLPAGTFGHVLEVEDWFGPGKPSFLRVNAYINITDENPEGETVESRIEETSFCIEPVSDLSAVKNFLKYNGNCDNDGCSASDAPVIVTSGDFQKMEEPTILSLSTVIDSPTLSPTVMEQTSAPTMEDVTAPPMESVDSEMVGNCLAALEDAKNNPQELIGEVDECSCDWVGRGTDLDMMFFCQQGNICYNLIEDWCNIGEKFCQHPYVD